MEYEVLAVQNLTKRRRYAWSNLNCLKRLGSGVDYLLSIISAISWLAYVIHSQKFKIFYREPVIFDGKKDIFFKSPVNDLCGNLDHKFTFVSNINVVISKMSLGDTMQSFFMYCRDLFFINSISTDPLTPSNKIFLTTGSPSIYANQSHSNSLKMTYKN